MREGEARSGAVGPGIFVVAVILLVLMSSVPLSSASCAVEQYPGAWPTTGVTSSVPSDHHGESCQHSSPRVGVAAVHRLQDRLPSVAELSPPCGRGKVDRPIDGATRSTVSAEATPEWRLSGRALLSMAQISRT